MLPWDKDYAFWAVDWDIFRGVDQNVLARRVLAIPSMHRLYLDTLVACAASMSAPVSSDSSKGWFEAEVEKETAQIHAAGLEDREKPYSDDRFDDELAKVLAFAKARASYVMREAQKALAENR